MGNNYDSVAIIPQNKKSAIGKLFVPEEGLEPSSLSALDFESSMFANFITLAV